MEHYEILRSLRDDTERWLENWGWNIFFEIIEETEGNYFLKVSTHLINDVINSYNITDTTKLKFNLDLIDIYEKGLEITKAKKFYIDNPPLRKNEYGVFDHPGFYSFVFG